ncbi:MAG: ribbon-helix-helix protein, CopG family [Acidimicrobiales bacterium]
MTINVALTDEVAARLQAEAERRGLSVVELIEELAEDLPPAPSSGERRLSFIGIGHSGRNDLSVRHRDIRAQATADADAANF